MLQFLPESIQMQIIQEVFLDEEKMWRRVFGMGMANGRDVAFVMAGGNENVLIGLDPMNRIDGTIRVSAVGHDRRKANFSNYGAYSDLSAPGVGIYNAVSGPERFDSNDGTSMAAPLVASHHQHRRPQVVARQGYPDGAHRLGVRTLAQHRL